MMRIILMKDTLRSMAVGLMCTLTLVGFNQAMADDSAHETAYAEALQRLLAAQDNLLLEMQKIQSGKVAHFDFLQHEHIELLRDSRALQHPPASLAGELRAALREQAGQVLQLASAMEWTLADFLRSHAQISGAISSTVDLAGLASAGTADATRTALASLSEAARDFRQQPDAKSRSALLHSFEQAARLPLDPRYREELAMQQHLIAINVDPRQTAMGEISASRLKLVAAQLSELYFQSNQLLSAGL